MFKVDDRVRLTSMANLETKVHTLTVGSVGVVKGAAYEVAGAIYVGVLFDDPNEPDMYAVAIETLEKE